MITDPGILASWESEEQAADSLTFEQKRRLVEGMYQLARQFGHFTVSDMLEGLDSTLTMASHMSANVRPPSELDRPRS